MSDLRIFWNAGNVIFRVPGNQGKLIPHDTE
jgi:hypothetical protein